MRKSLAEQYYSNIINLCTLDVKAAHYYYTASIVTDQGEKTCDKVLAIDMMKDYELGFTDHIVIEVSVLKSTYIESIYPSRDNLKLNLMGTQVSEKDINLQLSHVDKTKRQFKAFLVDPVDFGVNSKDGIAISDNSDANKKTTLINIKFQLLYMPVEELMKFTAGGNFNAKPWEVLVHLMTESFKHLTGSQKVSGCDWAKPDKYEKEYDIVIPHGTKLIDLPRLIQRNWYGIYDHDIGSYCTQLNDRKDGVWYFYPLYDFDRYEKSDTRLTISIVPKMQQPDLRRTYHVRGRHVNAICTGDVQLSDGTSTTRMNEGDGVTFFDSSKLKQDAVKKVDGDGVYIDTSSAVKQVFKEGREDNLNFAPYLKDNEKLQSTLQNVTSMVARRNTTILKFVWEYGNPWLLTPGMPTKIIFYKQNKRYEVTGTLIKQASITQITGSMTVRKHATSVVLVVVVDQTKIKEVENGQYGGKKKGVSGGLFDSLAKLF